VLAGDHLRDLVSQEGDLLLLLAVPDLIKHTNKKTINIKTKIYKK